MAGLQVASVQPGPTCDQGTSAIAASPPCAAAGAAAAGDAAGAALLDAVCASGEGVDDEQPTTRTATTAATPTWLRHVLSEKVVMGCSFLRATDASGVR